MTDTLQDRLRRNALWVPGSVHAADNTEAAGRIDVLDAALRDVVRDYDRGWAPGDTDEAMAAARKLTAANIGEGG